MPHVYT